MWMILIPVIILILQIVSPVLESINKGRDLSLLLLDCSKPICLDALICGIVVKSIFTVALNFFNLSAFPSEAPKKVIQ